MNILVLDDNVERHEWFKKTLQGHNVTHTWTATQAIKAMHKQKFDTVFLDHDLGDFSIDNKPVEVSSDNFNLSFSPDFVNDGMYDAARRFLTGLDVCEWMIQNEFKCPANVLIHSWNIPGARRMAETLRTISWINVVVKEFGGTIHV